MSDCCDVPRENAFDLAYADLLPRYDTVAYIEGKASFTAIGSLEVDGEPIDAPKVIIATGSRPTVPNIPGIEQVAYLTSTTALELEQLPESLLVIGGGYIGAEIAQLFARAGVTVRHATSSLILDQCMDTTFSVLTDSIYWRERIIKLSGTLPILCWSE